MIDRLERHARDGWHTWFGRPAPDLEMVLGSGGPAHPARAAVFVFPTSSSRPRLVMKIAFSELEGGFIQHEFTALSTIRPLLPPDLLPTMPQALDLIVESDFTVLSVTALDGRRLLVPYLAAPANPLSRRLMGQFFRRSFEWSSRLAEATRHPEDRDERALGAVIERFKGRAAAPSRKAGDRLDSFRRAIEQSRIRWHPVWQHGDLAVGNVLLRQRTLQCLDWEHAIPQGEPWFDAAQAPAATSRLARRQSIARSAREAALSVLAPGHWVGDRLQEELRHVWHHPLPLGWAVAVTAMATALRQQEDRRMGADDWADFAAALVVDDEVRSAIPWLVPHW